MLINKLCYRRFFLTLSFIVFYWAILFAQEVKFSYMRFVTVINYDEEIRRLLHPYFVYVDKWHNEVYVIDSRGGRIIVYDDKFYPVIMLDKRYGIRSPLAVSVDPAGNLYVLENYYDGKDTRYKVLVFDRAFLLRKIIEIDKRYSVHKIAVDDKGRIFVAVGVAVNGNGNGNGNGNNGKLNGVLVLNRDGEEIGFLSPEKSVMINEVKIDKKGRVFLVSYINSAIYVYDRDLNYQFRFGEKGGVTGKLSIPKGVGIDEERDVAYVVDYMRHSVSVYNLSEGGKWLFEFGGMGWPEGWFQFPSAIDVDSKGRVFVADTFNSRVQVFEPYEGVGIKPEDARNRVVKLKTPDNIFKVSYIRDVIN